MHLIEDINFFENIGLLQYTPFCAELKYNTVCRNVCILELLTIPLFIIYIIYTIFNIIIFFIIDITIILDIYDIYFYMKNTILKNVYNTIFVLIRYYISVGMER